MAAKGAGHIRARLLDSSFLIVFLSIALSSVELPSSAQTISPFHGMLLSAKGEILKSIEVHKRDQTSARATLSQALQLRQAAFARSDAANAAIAEQAGEVAKQTIATIEKMLSDDQVRLDAINRALTWPETEKPPAVVTRVRGHISKRTAQGPVPFDAASPVSPGDVITTDQDGYLELLLQDGSRLDAGPMTSISYGGEDRGLLYRLLKGRMRAVRVPTAVRGANDEPRYRGLVSIAAVRGTEFILEASGAGDVFTVFSGLLEVTRGQDRVDLVAGQRLAVGASGALGQPAAFDPKAVSRWWEQ